MAKPPHKTEESVGTVVGVPNGLRTVLSTPTAIIEGTNRGKLASAHTVPANSSATLRYLLDGEEHYFSLSRRSFCFIGRSNSSNICLVDRYVSFDHALIRCTASGTCELTDLRSSYGTRVNGKKVECTVLLKDGDKIQLGQYEFNFIQSVPLPDIVDTASDLEDVFPPKSLVSALMLEVLGSDGLSQILGDTLFAMLLDDIGTISDEVFARHHASKTHRQGNTIRAIWEHDGDHLTPVDLLSIIYAIEEIRIDMRPLQKRYHLLRPIEFGGSLFDGKVWINKFDQIYGEPFTVLHDLLKQAYQLELASHNTVSNLHSSKDARLNLLDEAASTADQAIDPYQAFEDATRAEAVALLGGDAVLGRAIRNDQELLEALIQGFPADVLRALRDAGLPHTMFEQVVAPRRTLMRRKAEGQRLTRSESDAVWRLSVAFALGARVLNGRKAAVDWLSRPKSTFANQTPIDLLETSVGAAHVYQMLRRLEWGDVA